jgi:hypothetical protein
MSRTDIHHREAKAITGGSMLRSARAMLCSAICVLGVISLPAVASASTTIDHFTLDSYHAGKKTFTPPASSEAKLQNGLYVATVQGTFSYYAAINFAVPQAPWTILCGTPEEAPEFGSAGGSGKVGFDAEFVISRPWLPEPCAQAKLPVKWINFQMNSGTGVWAHPDALGAPTAPTPHHTYEYALVGHKHHKVSFRLFDIATRDNYGSLHISLREATAADCAGTKYEAFGLSSEAECLSQLL